MQSYKHLKFILILLPFICFSSFGKEKQFKEKKVFSSEEIHSITVKAVHIDITVTKKPHTGFFDKMERGLVF